MNEFASVEDVGPDWHMDPILMVPAAGRRPQLPMGVDKMSRAA